jgi:hypothetical protein
MDEVCPLLGDCCPVTCAGDAYLNTATDTSSAYGAFETHCLSLPDVAD